MERQLTAVRFRYQKVGDVAKRGPYDFDIVHPQRAPGDVWIETQGSSIWVCVAFEGSQDDAEEELTELQDRAEEWLQAECQGVRIID